MKPIITATKPNRHKIKIKFHPIKENLKSQCPQGTRSTHKAETTIIDYASALSPSLVKPLWLVLSLSLSLKIKWTPSIKPQTLISKPYRTNPILLLHHHHHHRGTLISSPFTLIPPLLLLLQLKNPNFLTPTIKTKP
jgi:hypothetical protein